MRLYVWWHLVQILFGVLVGNLVEWLVHRFLLHGWGKRPRDPFSFHWLVHHRVVRRLNYFDPDYLKPWRDWTGRTKEPAGVALLVFLAVPLVLVAPTLYGTLVFWGVLYYNLHRLSHLYPDFGKRWLPWHYDHHMGPNQNANWGVVLPLWDIILGTRIRHEHGNEG